MATRYLSALTRKPTSVPEGSSASDVGPFRLLVAPDRLKHEAAATKALEVTISKYRAAGLPLRGRINVAVVGSVRRSYFSPQEGIIRLAVAGLNKDGVDVLIHETAHWQHAYQLPGGYGNQRILDKYWEAMRIKSGPDSGSTQDKLLKQLNRLKLQIKALDAKIAAPPEVYKGQIFTMDFSGGARPYEMEVIRVLRGGAQVKFVVILQSAYATTSAPLITIGVNASGQAVGTIHNAAGTSVAAWAATTLGNNAQGALVHMTVAWDSTRPINGLHHVSVVTNGVAMPVASFTTAPLAPWTTFQPLYVATGVVAETGFDGEMILTQASLNVSV